MRFTMTERIYQMICQEFVTKAYGIFLKREFYGRHH